MADDDRQPPQAYDTVSPAGVGATTTNQVSPGTIQEILDTGDRDLIDQAFDQIEDAGDYDALARYVETLPDLPTLGMPVQVSSPAGVGSPGSQSFRSIQTTPESPRQPHLVGEAQVCCLLLEQRQVAGQQRVLGVMVVDVVDVVDVVVDVVLVVVDVVDVVLLVVVVVNVVVVVVVVVLVLVVVAAVAAVVVVVVVVAVVGGWWTTTTTNPHFAFDTCLKSSHPSRILDVWESASYLASSRFTTTFTDDVTRSRTISTRT